MLTVFVCLPHECPDDHAMIVIDTGARRLWAGYFTRSSAGVATRWYGSSDERALPDEVLRSFSARRGP